MGDYLDVFGTVGSHLAHADTFYQWHLAIELCGNALLVLLYSARQTSPNNPPEHPKPCSPFGIKPSTTRCRHPISLSPFPALLPPPLTFYSRPAFRMVKCKYITPKHRAYAATARVDKLALPRALFMAAKYRARRPVPTLPPAWICVPMKENSLSFHPPGSKPYPMLAAEPLVQPERWRTLYSFSLERPLIPDIDPARIAHTQPEYKGLPPAHIRDAWVFMNYR